MATPAAHIPYPRNQIFVGRDDELRRLGEWLAQPGAAVVVAGLGGVGKTQLAAEFSHACAEDRATWGGGVFWVPMVDPAGAGTAVAGAGRALGLPGYDALPLPEQIATVRRAWAGPERRLLVFDNCEDPTLLKEWRPAAGGARVLLTARRADWPRAAAATLKLGELPRAAARELLCRERSELLGIPLEKLCADPAAGAICEQLGDLALALHMAAAYLAQRPYLPLAAFLAQLQAQPLDHAALATLDDTSPTEHLQHVAQTIELSYALLADDRRPTTDDGAVTTQNSELKTQNSLARQLLDLAAHCAPAEPIPLDLLRRAAESKEQRAENQAGETAGDELTGAAIQRLVAIGLARYAGEGQALSVHRLVAAYARRGQDQAAVAALADVVADVLGWMTKEIDDAGLPARMLPLLPHAQHAAEAAEARGSQHAATLLNNLGYYFKSIAGYAKARALYERALRIDEATFGPDHPEVAIDVNNLGGVAKDQGDLPAARALYQRALQIFEQHLGDTHPNVATPVNNLGLVAQDQGDLPAARTLFERALRIDEATYGPDHPYVAIRVNNLGTVAQDQGDLPAARAYLERALRIDKAAYGPDHPKVAIRVNNLGGVAKAQGDLPAARALYERALRIDEAAFGPDHPNVAIRVNNLGMVAQNQGDLVAAHAYLERALRIDEAAYGPDHPNVAIRVNNLGSVAQNQGDLPAARALYQRALRIFEQHLGDTHPNIAVLVNNLGMVAKDQGDLPTARAYLERALWIDEAAYGPDHPNVAIRVNNLGSVAQDQGDLVAARALYQRALRIFEQKLGPEHPNTQIVRGNLASIPAQD
ncbi:MAG: FxSxx-COOH system tetratricopeptide repeat protein [Roseiflexaceae bacterium]